MRDAMLQLITARGPFIPSDLLSHISGVPTTRFKQCLRVSNTLPILKCSDKDSEPQRKQVRGPRLVALDEAREAVERWCPRRLQDFEEAVERYRLDTVTYVFSNEAMRMIGRQPSYWKIFVLKYNPQGIHVMPAPAPAWGGRKSPPFTKRDVQRAMPVIIVPLDEITRLMRDMEQEPKPRRRGLDKKVKQKRVLPSRPYEHEIPEELRIQGCISMREAAERSGYSLHYIGTLLRKGMIKGEKFSKRGLWAPNEEDLARYINECGGDQADYSRETGLVLMPRKKPLYSNETDVPKKKRRGRYSGGARLDERDAVDWITLRDAAELSGLKTPLLRELCISGAFSDTRKIGRCWVIKREVLLKVFDSSGLLVGNTLLKATPDKQKIYPRSESIVTDEKSSDSSSDSIHHAE